MTSNIGIHPFNLPDNDKSPPDTQSMYNYHMLLDLHVDISGEILAPENDIDILVNDGPLVQLVQSAQDVLNKSWTPSLIKNYC